MEWEQLLSTQRFKVKDRQVQHAFTESTREGIAVLRSDFLIDYDRVVFSSSFRRLGRKTQVHPFAECAHTHNRLSHSIEVASVGRSMGNQLGVMLVDELPGSVTPTDLGSIVQVACLAHDIGNPPFGHAGEEALRAWFRAPENERYLNGLGQKERQDLQTYEGNAHTIRIVTNLEMYKGAGGMRLSSACLGSLIKYPWTSSSEKGQRKFNFYQTELPLIESIFEELRLKQIAPQVWARHPLSYLMEAADDICYALLDLEDGVDLGFITEQDVEEILNPIINEVLYRAGLSPMQYCKMLRGKAIGNAVKEVVHTFVRHKKAIMNGEFPAKDLLTVCCQSISEGIETAKQMARERIFTHSSKLMAEIAVFPCLGSILSVLIPAAFEFVVLERKNELRIQHNLALKLLKEDPLTVEDTLYTAYMKVLDYVGGLTDDGAAKLARELSGIAMIK
ncbi:MAG: deoxyguanosinetriphosphate triphosphohydrolase [Neisseriaceae bacterium]